MTHLVKEEVEVEGWRIKKKVCLIQSKVSTYIRVGKVLARDLSTQAATIFFFLSCLVGQAWP